MVYNVLCIFIRVSVAILTTSNGNAFLWKGDERLDILPGYTNQEAKGGIKLSSLNGKKDVLQQDIKAQSLVKENVSRETLNGKTENEGAQKVQTKRRKNRIWERKKEILRVRNKQKKREDAQSQDTVESVKFSSLYHCFRENELSVVESAFNAAYLYCNDKYYTSQTPVKRQYENIYAHPKAWLKHQHWLWKPNKWSVAVGILDIVPKIKRMSQAFLLTLKRNRPRADLWRRIEYSHMAHEVYKGMTVVIGTVALLFVVSYGTKGVVDMTNKIPAVSVYIDDVYVGDVLSVSEAEKAKSAYESLVSVSMRTLYDLDCSVTYKPTLCLEKDLLQTAQLNAAFDTASRRSMKNGFGLYVDGMLAAVCQNRQWIDQALSDSLSLQLGNYSETQNVSYNNAITVSAGVFPESLFMSQGQVRELFSLEKVTKADKQIILDNTVAKHFENVLQTEQPDESAVGKLTINAASVGNSATNTFSVITDVSGENLGDESLGQYAVMNLTVQKQEVVREPVEFKIIRIADPQLAENKTKIQRKGQEGQKDVTYVVSYVGDTEVQRAVLSETIIVEPIDRVEIIGTRPLTEEEIRTASTGTYIWPSMGRISSGYSWRVLFNKNEFHKGLDICDDFGSDVVASDGGLVIKAGMDRSGYGNMVLIQHDDGTLTRYAHNSKLYVKEGQRVAQGEVIAAMGKTGQATGVHVHFEVIVNGSAEDPTKYLPER